MGVWGLAPQKNVLSTMPSRTSENALLEHKVKSLSFVPRRKLINQPGNER